MNEALIIGGMALVTLAVRYPALALFGRLTLPAGLLRALNYVPPVVLTAIIVPALVFQHDQVQISPTNSPLVAGIVTFLVAWRSRNLLLTIVIGMALFLAWRWLMATLGLGY
ncbi:MAG: AzlD domain-containing protein [Chloroflexota bacterium]|nr:AzlD domain-containing protein [Chloroflexota bacterium]